MGISEGSKVICINSAIKPEMAEFVHYHMPNWVSKDKVYTVRKICRNGGIVDGYLLEEITNPKCTLPKTLGAHFIEPRFGTFRFAEREEDESYERIVNEIKEEIIA